MDAGKTMRVLLTGYDRTRLERVHSLLRAIREVTANVCLLTESTSLDNALLEPTDVLVHILSPSPEADLQTLQRLKAQLPPLILVGGDSQLLEEQQLGQILRTGARDYLKQPFDEGELLQALDRIHDDFCQSQQARSGAAGQVIAVTGVGGGSGVSLLSACLAYEAACRDEKVLLADCDWRYGSQATLHDVRPRNDFRELMARPGRDSTALESYLTPVNKQLQLLCQAPDRIATVPPSDNLHPLLNLMRSQADVTILDLPGWDEHLLTTWSGRADRVVLVVRPQIDAIRRAGLLLQASLASVERERLTVVVNCVTRYTTIDKQTIAKALGITPVIVPSSSKLVVRALENGQLPVQQMPDAPFSRAVARLGDVLLSSKRSRPGLTNWLKHLRRAS